MQVLTGIDTPHVDIWTSKKVKWNNHGAWNTWRTNEEQDMSLLKDLGCLFLRLNEPWSLVQLGPKKFRRDRLDAIANAAAKLGITLMYPVTHFNYPEWVRGKTELHPVLSKGLPDALARYTEWIMENYRFPYIVPIVECHIDSMFRGKWGLWAPHRKTMYEPVLENLVRAFHASAAVARGFRATVVCAEPADAFPIAKLLAGSCHILGIDYYMQFHYPVPRKFRAKRAPLLYFLREWSVLNKPVGINEFGAPESYDIRRRQLGRGRGKAGQDANRVAVARYLHSELAKAFQENIIVPFGSWFPGLGNFWANGLTRKPQSCDRAGLVDLERTQGKLVRVPCMNLIGEIKKIEGMAAGQLAA
jgi:hypothetical protein